MPCLRLCTIAARTTKALSNAHDPIAATAANNNGVTVFTNGQRCTTDMLDHALERAANGILPKGGHDSPVPTTTVVVEWLPQPPPRRPRHGPAPTQSATVSDWTRPRHALSLDADTHWHSGCCPSPPSPCLPVHPPSPTSPSQQQLLRNKTSHPAQSETWPKYGPLPQAM